jgi:hypothetical protein
MIRRRAPASNLIFLCKPVIPVITRRDHFPICLSSSTSPFIAIETAIMARVAVVTHAHKHECCRRLAGFKISGPK